MVISTRKSKKIGRVLSGLAVMGFIFSTAPVGAQTTTASPTTTGSSGGVCSPGTDSTDQAGKGNDDAKSKITAAATSLIAQGVANASTIQSALGSYTKDRESCVSGQSNAAMACLENCSSNISSALSALNTLAAALSGAASATGSCSDFSKLMDIANKALTAYSGLCATMKGTCVNDCKSATGSLDKLKAAVDAASCPAGLASCSAATVATQKNAADTAIASEKSTSDKTSVAGKSNTCNDKYAQLLTSAAAGIASMIAGMMQGNQCAEDTSATATTVDCTDASQAQTPTCLCAANPRLQGCALASSTSAGSSSTIGSTSATTGSTSTDTPDLSGTTATDTATAASSGSGSVGGAAGAGSSLGGGSSLSGSPEAQAAAAKGSSLDTNVLAGTSGGGGGAWGGGSGFESDKEKYKDYLPGGKKDPNVGGTSMANEVTGGGGKSNWEKVRERYNDNKPTLLNN